MSSMPAALLFLSAAIPFLYSSSLNADTNDGFPSTVGRQYNLLLLLVLSVCHVSSMARADGPGFEPRPGLTRHIQCSVDYTVHIRLIPSAVILSIYVFK